MTAAPAIGRRMLSGRRAALSLHVRPMSERTRPELSPPLGSKDPLTEEAQQPATLDRPRWWFRRQTPEWRARNNASARAWRQRQRELQAQGDQGALARYARRQVYLEQTKEQRRAYNTEYQRARRARLREQATQAGAG